MHSRSSRVSKPTPSTSATSCDAPTPLSGRVASRLASSASDTSVVQTTKYLGQSLDWYLHHFGLIVSDFSTTRASATVARS